MTHRYEIIARGICYMTANHMYDAEMRALHTANEIGDYVFIRYTGELPMYSVDYGDMEPFSIIKKVHPTPKPPEQSEDDEF